MNNKLNSLQKKTINKINELFDSKLYNTQAKTKDFFLNNDNVELRLIYRLERIIIVFYLYYDQIEYTISDSEKEISHCLIEDFFHEDEMLVRFSNYLKTDLKKILSSDELKDIL